MYFLCKSIKKMNVNFLNFSLGIFLMYGCSHENTFILEFYNWNRKEEKYKCCGLFWKVCETSRKNANTSQPCTIRKDEEQIYWITEINNYFTKEIWLTCAGLSAVLLKVLQKERYKFSWLRSCNFIAWFHDVHT